MNAKLQVVLISISNEPLYLSCSVLQCLNLLCEPGNESDPAPLLLLAVSISLWQTRFTMDAWLEVLHAETDPSVIQEEQTAAETFCMKSIILATRALPVVTAYAR